MSNRKPIFGFEERKVPMRGTIFGFEEPAWKEQRRLRDTVRAERLKQGIEKWLKENPMITGRPKPKPIPKPTVPRWDRSHGEYIAGRAALDGVDVVAVAMEDKWGNGRLRLLVSTEMRERFDRQRYKLNMAVTNGTLADVLREAPRMVAGWKSLDLMADRAKAVRKPDDVWEVTLEDGSVAAIAKDYDSRLVQGRAVAVYTLDEIAHILSSYKATHKAKLTWPGATVVRVGKSIADPLDGISEATGLDDPIDDLWTG